MEGYEKLNEMIALLQNVQDANPHLGVSHVVTAQDVLEYVNEEPETLQELLEMGKSLATDEYVGENITPNFVADLVDEWKLLPSDIKLLNLDYRAIRDYFDRTTTYAQLTERQQGYLESLRYTGDDFTVDSGNYGFEHKAVNGVNVKEQLVGRLKEDGYVTDGMIRQLEQKEISFRLGAPEWTYGYLDSAVGAQRPGVVGPGKAEHPSNVELQEWLVEAEDVLGGRGAD